MAKNNERYVFDINEIVKFIFGEEVERTHDTEITETYLQPENGGPLELNSKVIHEVKGSDNTNKQTIKYDMLKMFIDILDGIESTSTSMSLGETLTFNTMQNYGFIREVK